MSADHEREDSAALAERAAAGDREALEELLERHLPELRAFVRLRAGAALRARESASDLVQSTCREVLTHAERFQFPSESAFRRWLFTTALRKVSNRAAHLGAAKRAGPEVPLAPTSSAGDDGLIACYHRFSSPSHRVTVQDEIDRVERAFDTLTDEQREVVTMAHVVGMSRAEIAEQLGKSENAVRIVLHRALARLADRVKSEEE